RGLAHDRIQGRADRHAVGDPHGGEPPVTATTPTLGEGKRALVLVGGGITGAMYEFGCLRAFDDFFQGEFSSLDFDLYTGPRAGAVVGMLMANGVSPASVMDIIATSQKHPLNFRAEDIFHFDWE